MLLKGTSPTHMDEKDQQKKAARVKMIVSVYLHCTSSAFSVKTKTNKQTNKTLIKERMLLRHFHKMLQDKMFLFGF